MSNSLMDYLPEFYHDIVDFAEWTGTEEVEMVSAAQAVQQLFDDQFVMTSQEQAIKRREKILGIQADPLTESLDFRKKRIINRYSTKPPFTIRYLQERLDFLVGTGHTIASVDPLHFILTVTAKIEEASLFKEVEYTVKAIKPANIIYRQETALEDTIKLEEHISLQKLNRETRLSTLWHLGRTPFAVLEQEVILK
ncbi:putative phage tail protein [Paenibacillus sepulcri]|uniref:YmfQ family protein n=1 Tax=Paenibacillus sepulcri TaxID=359917 RepID=A0ABS7C181_9BACL|nr:YmfQ family protein [Paenibacillus sepulcri]